MRVRIPLLIIFPALIAVMAACDKQSSSPPTPPPVSPPALQADFYTPGKVVMEFREVVEKEMDVDPAKVETLKDRNEEPIRVFISPIISTADIEIISVEDDMYRRGQKSMTFYFKQSSWRKVEDETKRLCGKRLAFVHDGQILAATKVWGALRDSAQLSNTGLNPAYMKLIAAMQPAKEPPNRAERSKAMREWLEEQLANGSKNLDHMKDLALSYYGDKEYEKAVPFFKMLAQAEPSIVKSTLNDTPNSSFTFTRGMSKGDVFLMLGSCYMFMEQYDEALRCFEKIINDDPKNIHSIRLAMAMAYLGKGDKDAALREIAEARKALESSNLKGAKKAQALQAIEKGKAAILDH